MSFACASARKVHDSLGLAALVVDFEPVQVARLVDLRNGVYDHNGQVLSRNVCGSW